MAQIEAKLYVKQLTLKCSKAAKAIAEGPKEEDKDKQLLRMQGEMEKLRARNKSLQDAMEATTNKLSYTGPWKLGDHVVLMAGGPNCDDIGKTVEIGGGARVVHDIYYKPEKQLPCESRKKSWPVDFVTLAERR